MANWKIYKISEDLIVWQIRIDFFSIIKICDIFKNFMANFKHFSIFKKPISIYLKIPNSYKARFT